MTIEYGHPPKTYELIIYVFIMVIVAWCFYYQLRHLQKMTILPVYILPFCTICIFYENLILALGTLVGNDSIPAFIAYVLHSFQIPILLTSMVEVCYRLYETRSAQFFFIRFDEAESGDFSPVGALAFLYGMRIVSIGLLGINLHIHFGHGDQIRTGGYYVLARNVNNLELWLSLIPPMVLSFFSIVVSVAAIR